MTLAREIGGRIRSALYEKGMKQRDLAEKLDVPDNTVSRYVIGYRLIRIDMLVRIADALDVSVDWLLGRSNGKGDE